MRSFGFRTVCEAVEDHVYKRLPVKAEFELLPWTVSPPRVTETAPTFRTMTCICGAALVSLLGEAVKVATSMATLDCAA